MPGQELLRGGQGPVKSNSVRVLLWQHVRKEGSQRALARKIGVSPTFLNDILLEKREPAGKVVTFLGLQRVVTYIRAADSRES